MPTTTPGGLIRVPEPGDIPDVPGDMLKLGADIETLIKVLADLGQWIKFGRVDRVVEGNGYLRLMAAESFPGGKAPISIVGIGINEQFTPTWAGLADGAGCLLRIVKPDNTWWAPGSTVALYFIAVGNPPALPTPD